VTKLFLINWLESSDENQCYLDYEALINSDDEYLCLSSMADCNFDSLISDEVYYDQSC